MREVWEHVRQGALHFPQRVVAPPQHPVRQFIHGLSLPFHLARALRTNEEAWRRYLRVAIVQSLVVLALGFLFTGSANEAADAVRDQPQNKGVSITLSSSSSSIELPPVPAPVDSSETPASSPRVVRKRVIDEVQFWAALIATLQIIQWVVIALSRDYHDAISRDASLLTAIEPEDGPLTPRVRLDLPWMGKKFSRRVRGFLVVLTGVPVIIMFTAPLCLMTNAMAVLVPLWSAYWLVVFTTSKTALSWDDTSGREPWFLRAWKWLTTKMPGFRWGFLQAYGRFWENRTRSVFSPAVELEKQPWAFAGLAVIRALSMLPLVKCFLRPLIPVAAAHLVLAHRASAPIVSLEQSAPVAEPAASSSNAA